MKLTYIVAALGLAASVAANAEIGGPKGSAAHPDLAPELFFVAYDGSNSFTLDLGVTYSSFVANNGSSATWATLNSSDTVWSNFIATADKSSLQYSVIGSGAGALTPTVATVQQGEESTISDPSYGYQNSNVTNAIPQIQAYVNAVNVTGTHKTLANGESVNAKGSGAYFQDFNTASFNSSFFDTNNAVGSASEFTLVMRGPGGNLAPLSETVQPGTVLFAQSGSDYVLRYTTVAAVPEASGYALALAGFGAVGLVKRRRRDKK